MFSYAESALGSAPFEAFCLFLDPVSAAGVFFRQFGQDTRDILGGQRKAKLTIQNFCGDRRSIRKKHSGPTSLAPPVKVCEYRVPWKSLLILKTKKSHENVFANGLTDRLDIGIPGKVKMNSPNAREVHLQLGIQVK